MDRTIRFVALFALALAALALAGCSAGGMDGAEDMGVWGYVTSADSAQLDVPARQAAAGVVVVDRVLAPTDAWLVVHVNEDGKPGKRIGLDFVRQGESLNVSIPLEGAKEATSAIVALHADKGTSGGFDFTMEKAQESPDRPYFVDGEELARTTALAPVR